MRFLVPRSTSRVMEVSLHCIETKVQRGFSRRCDGGVASAQARTGIQQGAVGKGSPGKVGRVCGKGVSGQSTGQRGGKQVGAQGCTGCAEGAGTCAACRARPAALHNTQHSGPTREPT